MHAFPIGGLIKCRDQLITSLLSVSCSRFITMKIIQFFKQRLIVRFTQQYECLSFLFHAFYITTLGNFADINSVYNMTTFK